MHLLLADSKHPQMKHPDNVKGQQAELDAGCACFFPMQHEPAFQINPTASFPVSGIPQGGRERDFVSQRLKL